MNLQPCDVIFVKQRRHPTLKDKIIGWLVKWATKSEYSHVAYFIYHNQVFEANSFRLAGIADLNDYAEYEVKRLSFTIDVRERILQRILSTGGAKYGWGEVVALLLRKRFGIPVYYDSPDAYECAEELQKAVRAETGIWIIEQTTGDISPQDLWESPWLKEVVCSVKENFPEH